MARKTTKTSPKTIASQFASPADLVYFERTTSRISWDHIQLRNIEMDRPANRIPARIVECSCGHQFTTTKRSIQCPECGAWLEVRLNPDHERYTRGLGVTVSGNETYDIGDATADMLRGLSPWAAVQAAAVWLAGCTIDAMSRGFRKAYGDRPWTADEINSYLQGKYSGLNDGMVRMNAGNLVRAAIKRANA